MRCKLLCTGFIVLFLLQGCATEQIVQRGDTKELEQFLEEKRNRRKTVEFTSNRVVFTKNVHFQGDDTLQVASKTYSLNQVNRIESRQFNPLSFLVTAMGFGAVLFTNLPETNCVVASCDATTESYISDNALYKVGLAAVTVFSVIIIERNTPPEVFVVEPDSNVKQTD